VLVTDNPITLGTTNLSFSLMNGGSGTTYTAGNGISVNAGVVAINTASGGGLIAAAGGLSLDPAIAVRKYAANVGDGTSTTITLNHNLGSRDVIVDIYTNAAPYDTVYCEVQRTDLNNVALIFGSAPAAAAYRAVLHV
jgi:hypothetical protein